MTIVKKKTTSPKKQPKRRLLFYIIALSLPFLFFFLIELGLRLSDYDGNLDLFIPAGGDFTDYYICNPLVGRRYFFMQKTVPSPPNDLFLKKKPANGYRIFVLGGSTTAGYPYGSNMMFSRILQQRLSDLFPTRHIEVVNTAMTAVNSYTLLDFMDEILKYQADAILIYAGHNEYYGALGIASNESLGRFPAFVKLYLKLQRFKTFLLLRNFIGSVKKWLHRSADGTKAPATLMERIVADQVIPYKSDLYESGKRQFASNLRSIFRKAKQAGVRILIGDLVSNVRGLEPFISVKTDTFPAADDVYQQAVTYEKENKMQLAKTAYIRAKDLDVLRFRAPEEFNQIIYSIADEYQVPVVPVTSYFEKHSPNGIIGNQLMVDHLHPNTAGYFLMADAFFDAMRQHGFIAPTWNTRRIAPATYYHRNWGFTALDSMAADLGIRILKSHWPFTSKNSMHQTAFNFHPANEVDSLALKIIFDNKITLASGHEKLAKYYTERKQFEKAFAEYNALIDTAPYMVSHYLNAADMLIKARQLNRALPFLIKSLNHKVTGFAVKWIGQIYLTKGRTQDAIKLLNQALKFGPHDPQVLYNLCVAYIAKRQFNLARSVFKQLQNISPDFSGVEDLKRHLEQKPHH